MRSKEIKNCFTACDVARFDTTFALNFWLIFLKYFWLQALKRTLSFNKFIKGYQALLYRVQERYGIKDPTTALEFNELMEYVERLNSEYFFP